MPGGDRTGPMGMGPRTGRGLGYCSGYSAPGWTAPVGYGMGARFGGFGFGRGGWGRGRGWGRGWYGWYGASVVGYGAPYGWAGVPYGAPLTKDDEVQALSAQAAGLQRALADVKRRLSELEQDKDSADD